jgi:hypothetical protein
VSARGTDLVSGARVDGDLDLPGGRCALIREDP